MSTEINHKRIVKEALEIWQKRGTYDQEQLDRAVEILVRHDMWSMTQMAKILDVNVRQVTTRTTKKETTGGRFDPATLELALEEISLAELGDSNPMLTARIWDMGTSPSFLAKLIGQPTSSVQWRAARGRELAGGGDG